MGNWQKPSHEIVQHDFHISYMTPLQSDGATASATATGGDSGAHVYGAAYLTCLWAWGKFTYGNRRFSLRVGRSSILFLPARNPNWYEVSVFGIQCKSFKLEMRSEEEPPPANPSATDWQLDCGSDWRSSSSGDLDQLEEWVSAPSSHVMCAKWQGEGSTTENRSDIVLKYQNQVSPTFSPQREVFTSMWVSCLSDDKAESRDNIVASILCQIYI